MPKENELAFGKPDGDPFHRLLEDDPLITRVQTDRLLTKPAALPSEVRLVIEVIIAISRAHISNPGFLTS
jgi:hypothetical protein